MNKALLLLAGLALAIAVFSPAFAQPIDDDEDFDDGYSQLALFEKDDVEVAGLSADMQIFADYCLRTRDEVRLFLKDSVSTGAKRVFNILFNSDEDFDLDHDFDHDLDAEAVEESAKIIKDATVATIGDGVNDEAELEEKVDAVKKSGVMAALSSAVRAVLNSAIEFVSSEAAKRLAKLKAKFTPEEIKMFVTDACESITFKLKKNLNDGLHQEKSQLMKSTSSKQFKKVLGSLNVEDVGCVTTNRIATMSKVCNFINVAGPTLFPIFGI